MLKRTEALIAAPIAATSVWCDPGSGGDADRMFRSHLFRGAGKCERCGVTRQAVNRLRSRHRSGRADRTGAMHFALIKSADWDAKSGVRLDAITAAKRLLEVGFWPLWEHTPGRVVVDAGDRVCIYLSGTSIVVASATIANVEPWSRDFSAAYPLVLGGTPELVLRLSGVLLFERPVEVAKHVELLDCVGTNKKKWGAAFCGGMRSLTVHDYGILTAVPAASSDL